MFINFIFPQYMSLEQVNDDYVNEISALVNCRNEKEIPDTRQQKSQKDVDDNVDYLKMCREHVYNFMIDCMPVSYSYDYGFGFGYGYSNSYTYGNS